MDYNPFSPEVKENPYPYYAYLRRHAPVYEIEGIGWWAITRYDDVLAILRNPETFSSSIMMVAVMGEFNFAPEAIIGMDPPVHTRLRKLVNRAFTPRLVASLESRVREITQDLIAPMRAAGEFDLMAGLANPLPVMVIAEMLGVEPARWDDFKEWTNAIVLAMGGQVAEDQRDYVRRNISALQAYIRDMIAARRKVPRNDLITALIRAEEE
ncbi:MAG: cytochrome P450, partial [Candidatus Binatia bacterium]